MYGGKLAMAQISVDKRRGTDIQTTPAKLYSHDSPSIWREALLPYLITRVALFLVGLLAAFYILPLLKSSPILPSVSASTGFPGVLWVMWDRFDSGFYLDIARHGYWAASTLNRASNWIFLPLYPMCIFAFAHLLGGSRAAFYLAGILISNAFGLVAVSYLYKLVRLDFNARVASLTVIFLALFPTSFYLSAIYPESLFLACAVACIYYARRRQWWLAGICGALASLARIQGLGLVIPVVWEFWQMLSDRYAPLPDMSGATLLEKGKIWLNSRLKGLLLATREMRNWLNLLAVALIPLGLVPFLVYSQIKTGDFLATIHNHTVGWGRKPELFLRLIAGALLHPRLPDPMDWNFWLVNIITIFVFLSFTLWALRKLPVMYILYMAVMLLLPLSTGSINSISRYCLIVFPAFMLLALWTSRTKESGYGFFILTLLAMVQAVFMVFYVLGLPIIA